MMPEKAFLTLVLDIFASMLADSLANSLQYGHAGCWSKECHDDVPWGSGTDRTAQRYC